MADETLTLSPAPGFSTLIGYFVSGLNDARQQLQDGVAGLSDKQITRRAVEGAHPIGALVLHIGEAEWWWIQCVINGRHAMTDDDRRTAHWDVLEDPDGFASNSYSAQYCLDAIEVISDLTRKILATFTDDDLDRLFSYQKRGKTVEVSVRWVLHHLIDHEARHTGQILMLKRLLA